MNSFDSIVSFGSTTSDTDNTALSSPQGVVVNPVDKVVAVLDSGNNRIQVFDLQGLKYRSTVSTWGDYNQYSFTDLGDIAYYDGSYFVSETGYHVLIRFDKDFNYIQHFGTYDTSDTDSASLSSPQGVDAREDAVYVADYANDRVMILTNRLEYSDSFTVSTPYGIHYNEMNDNLIVTNSTDSRVEKYKMDGNRISYSSCSIGSPGYVTVLHDKIYIADITNNIVQVLSTADLTYLESDGTYTSCGGIDGFDNSLFISSQHKLDSIYCYLPELSITPSSTPVIGGNRYRTPSNIVGQTVCGGESDRNEFVEEDKLSDSILWENE